MSEKPKGFLPAFYKRPPCLVALVLIASACFGASVITVNIVRTENVQGTWAADFCRIIAVVLNRSGATCSDSAPTNTASLQPPILTSFPVTSPGPQSTDRISSSCSEVVSQSNVPPNGTTYTLTVQPNTFELWTSGDVVVDGIAFTGGVSKGNVIAFSPKQNQPTTYHLTGLIPQNSWHGIYSGCDETNKQDWIATKISRMQTSNCVNGGCKIVEIGIFQGTLIKRYSVSKNEN